MEYVGERLVAQKLRILGFSCVHYGDRPGHDAALWHQCLREIHTTDNLICFGLGDYLDWTRTTHRLPLKATFGEDDKAFAQLDEMVMETFVYPFVDTVRKHCPSFAKKCLGLVEGNHHGRMLSAQFRNGRTTTEEICRLLGVRYLGLSAWVRLTVYRSAGKTKFGAGHNLNIVLNHSVSTSGNLPASLASAKRKIQDFRGVDIFLSANDHQLGHSPGQQLGCAQNGLPRQVQHQQVIGKVGSFQKGYKDGAVSDDYVEKKFLGPNQLGYLAFDAWIHRHSQTNAMRHAIGRHDSPEAWRFDNFNV